MTTVAEALVNEGKLRDVVEMLVGLRVIGIERGMCFSKLGAWWRWESADYGAYTITCRSPKELIVLMKDADGKVVTGINSNDFEQPYNKLPIECEDGLLYWGRDYYLQVNEVHGMVGQLVITQVNRFTGEHCHYVTTKDELPSLALQILEEKHCE